MILLHYHHGPVVPSGSNLRASTVGSPELVEVVVAGSLFHKHHEAYRVLVKCLLDQSVAGVGQAYHIQRLNLKILVNQDEDLRLSTLYVAGHC